MRQEAGYGGEFRRGTIGGIGEVWHSEQAGLWQSTVLPHCFNAYDACDPDKPYFRGEGWYRARLSLRNPFVEGRTILNFQGAGQTTTLWVGSLLIGTHKGGYDEFDFDITEALQRLPLADAKGGVPLTVLCDNSPDPDRVPSDLSDFCLYGGIYRHVNLVYVPAVALETIHVLPIVAADGSAQVLIKTRNGSGWLANMRRLGNFRSGSSWKQASWRTFRKTGQRCWRRIGVS
jgi:beta-galactosidase